MVIEIKNLRNEKPTAEWEVRVDRTSVLGNPFKMDNEDQRADVCEKYRKYFYSMFKGKLIPMFSYEGMWPYRDAFVEELRKLYKLAKKYGKLSLYCWCAPKQCHAETIKEFLESYLNK